MRTMAILVAVMLGGCAIYGGDDQPIPTDGIGGGWEMRVNLNPCVASPAPITVSFDVDSDNEAVSRIAISGESIDDFGLTQESIVWITTDAMDTWEILLWDDGVEAGALVEWRGLNDCEIETEPDSIVRDRP